MAKSQRGLIATVAIIALLIVVIGVGIINFTSSGNKVTETSLSTVTTSITSTVVQAMTTRISTLVVFNATTVTQPTTQTETTVVKDTVTSSSILTVTQNSLGVSQVSVTSVTLYGGTTATNSSQPTSSLLISFNNQNSSTYITSIILETPSGIPITAWDNSSVPSSPGNLIVFSSSHPGNNALAGSAISFFTFYPESLSPVSIVSGDSFRYTILFASGSLIQGTIIAQ